MHLLLVLDRLKQEVMSKAPILMQPPGNTSPHTFTFLGILQTLLGTSTAPT